MDDQAIHDLASNILEHIRADDKTPEWGIADYKLKGELAQSVLDLIHHMTRKEA